MSAKDQLRKALETIQAIQKAHEGQSIPPDQMEKMTKLIEEAEGLKAQMETEERAETLTKWASESSGRLPMVSQQAAATGTSEPVLVKGGETIIDRKPGSTLINEYGEGLMSAEAMEAIGSAEYKSAFHAYMRKGINGISGAEYKVLQEGSDTQGGFLVPEDMLNRIVQKEPTPTRVAGRVTRLTTSRDTLTMPKVNYTTDDLYTTGMRVTFTGEIPASSTAHRVTEPVFGQTRADIYTAMMSLPLTNNMIEDSAFPVLSWASGKFTETVDLLYDNMVLNGTGVGQPHGILKNPGATDEPAIVVSGNASLLTADGLLDLAFTVPEQYDDNSVFVMNKTNTAKAIAKLKDGQNRYLWGDGLQDSGLSPAIRGRALAGYPVIWSGFAPNIAANAFPVVFGDLRGYFLVQRVGMSVQVLRELYAETNQVLLLGRIRFGGIVAEPFRLKVQKVST